MKIRFIFFFASAVASSAMLFFPELNGVFQIHSAAFSKSTLAPMLKTKPRVIVSFCLLFSAQTKAVKYDGTDNLNEGVIKFLRSIDADVIPVCPEVSGGLPVPRPKATLAGTGPEVLLGEARIMNAEGQDVTEEFVSGAQAEINRILSSGSKPQLAILKHRSPSCSPDKIYVQKKGQEKPELVDGKGVFAQMLEVAGIKVVTENDIKNSPSEIYFLLGLNSQAFAQAA